MLERGRITSRQLIWLIGVSIFPTLALFIPRIVIADAREDAWLAAVLAPLLAMPLLWFAARLAARFPDRTVVGSGRTLFGRCGGGLFGWGVAGGFIYTTAIVLRQLSEITISIFFETTPLVVLAGLLLVFAAWAVKSGLEVIARVNDALLVTVILPILLLLAAALPDFDGRNLAPVLARGLAPVMRAVYHQIIFFAGAALMFLMLFPAQRRAEHGWRSLALNTASLGLVNLVVILVILGTMGSLAAQRRFPLLDVVRYLRVTENVVERMDAVLLMIWLANGFIQVSLFYYGAVVAGAEAAGLRAYQPLTLPMGVLILAVAIKGFPNASYIDTLLSRELPPLYLGMEVGMPLGLLVVAWLTGRRARA